MFEIVRVHDDVLPINRARLARCSEILLAQIPTCTEEQRSHLVSCLHDPVTARFRSILLVAEQRRTINGFALFMHEPTLRFSYLDYLCVAPGRAAGGIGGALYERVREECAWLRAEGLFFECWPDEPELLFDQKELEQAKQRLRFYERYGARPILGTYWDQPVGDGSPLTHLMYDDLGSKRQLTRKRLRQVMRALLERRYRSSVRPEEISRYLDSVLDDPILLRPPRYQKKPVEVVPSASQWKLPMYVAEGHEEHHVPDKGYFEAPARLSAIVSVLSKAGIVSSQAISKFSDQHLRAVHRRGYLEFLDEVAQHRLTGPDITHVFPPRRMKGPPPTISGRASWYSTDTFTPLEAGAVRAARRAVDVVLSAADAVLKGAPLAYAAVRPPGHHAESACMGGYCYYSNSAIAAAYMVRRLSKVAILDLDYHHGNGQQEIFYRRADVTTVSVHADPRHSYPFFSGFAEESGSDEGTGYNLNLPLPLELDGDSWIERGVVPALARIFEDPPTGLVVALGLDTAVGDPTGSWSVKADHFRQAGRLIGALKIPTLVVQEGGYRTRTLGSNALAFFGGLMKARGLA